eukprot:7068607-Pyramimonas_sp.AAC.1
MAQQVQKDIETIKEQRQRLLSHKRKKCNDGASAAGAPAEEPEVAATGSTSAASSTQLGPSQEELDKINARKA